MQPQSPTHAVKPFATSKGRQGLGILCCCLFWVVKVIHKARRRSSLFAAHRDCSARDRVMTCVTRCPSGSCFVGQYCKQQFHRGHKHMTNLKLIPAASKTLSGVNLPRINFVLSVVFEGICEWADDAQTLLINEQVHWKNANKLCFVLSDAKTLQKSSLIFKICPLLKYSEFSSLYRSKMPSFISKKKKK